MPNLTTALPRRTGNLEDDYNRLYNWAVSLTDELKSLLCNLDAGNVTEAASIKAQNIDVSQARIKDAQITSLTADKLTAGTINAEEIEIKDASGNGEMDMSKQALKFFEGENLRIYIGRDDEGNYIFLVQNADESQGIYMNDDGNAVFCGTIRGGKIISDTDINVTKDATIGRRLVLQDKDNATTDYEEAGIISVDTGVMLISALNNRIININTGGIIKLSCNSCTINRRNILQEIDDIWAQLSK